MHPNHEEQEERIRTDLAATQRGALHLRSQLTHSCQHCSIIHPSDHETPFPSLFPHRLGAWC